VTTGAPPPENFRFIPVSRPLYPVAIAKQPEHSFGKMKFTTKPEKSNTFLKEIPHRSNSSLYLRNCRNTAIPLCGNYSLF
jgi:hypothetical protein